MKSNRRSKKKEKLCGTCAHMLLGFYCIRRGTLTSDDGSCPRWESPEEIHKRIRSTANKRKSAAGKLGGGKRNGSST